jgi:transposase
MTIDGATEAEVFRVYGAPVLCPTRHPGDMVLMDHLRAHTVAGIRAAMARAGVQLVYGPPYSPDVSPIERGWSKLKTARCTAKARTREALEHAMAQALATMTVSDARRWFRPCGYTLQ